MISFLGRLFSEDSLSPHGICLLWRPELIWTHALADATIGLSYASISIFLGYLLSRRPDIKFGWVVWCFAIFILACGATHFFSIYTLWVPDYGVEALVKAVTAVASVSTAVLLWPMLPAALAWPSPEQLALSNNALSATVSERDAALARVQEEHAKRQRAENLLRRTQKMEALGQLTGGMAHDYNNLLSVITMNLARIEKTLADHVPPGVKRSLEHAADASTRAAAITRRLLAFSMQSDVKIERTDVTRAVEAVQPLLQDAAGLDRKILFKLSSTLAADLDVGELENALLNLVLNARDATRPGGKIMVSVKDGEHDGARKVWIEVTDDGCGMAPEIVERALEPFFTTKPLGQGSGLGLSQVFGFAQRFRGEVVIASQINEGTSVQISLPAGEP